MGGELGGPGGKAPLLGHGIQGVYKCTAYKGGPGPGGLPRFGRLG